MEELRRVRSGCMDEYNELYTLHDILDAQYVYETKGDEKYLRKIIKPIEALLMEMPKIIVKDTSDTFYQFDIINAKRMILN